MSQHTKATCGVVPLHKNNSHIKLLQHCSFKHTGFSKIKHSLVGFFFFVFFVAGKSDDSHFMESLCIAVTLRMNVSRKHLKQRGS